MIYCSSNFGKAFLLYIFSNTGTNALSVKDQYKQDTEHYEKYILNLIQIMVYLLK